MEMLNEVMAGVDQDIQKFPPVAYLSSLTGAKPSMIVLPLVLVVLIFSVFLPSVGSTLVTIVTVFYPAFKTFEVSMN